jgi:hypothetical protein
MSVALEVLKKTVEELTKEVKIGTPLTAEEASKARTLLSTFVREFWNSPLGLKLRNELEKTASEYAIHLEDKAQELKLDVEYKKIAEAVDIGNKYRLTWGKPAKPKKKK